MLATVTVASLPTTLAPWLDSARRFMIILALVLLKLYSVFVVKVALDLALVVWLWTAVFAVQTTDILPGADLSTLTVLQGLQRE